MKQKYYNYEEWEEYKYGMWRKLPKHEEGKYLKKAIDFTKDHNLYGNAMLKVIKEWPISCLQNLTNNDINKKAWIGHAACCLAFNCPEYIVREAWSHLSTKEQKLANERAEQAILQWTLNYYDSLQLELFE
jgi:hypothetical protein